MAVVAHVHAVNQLEIDLGNLAHKNGTNAVRDYGNTLVKDQKRADKDLDSVARHEGMSRIPGDTNEGDLADRDATMARMARLKTLRGTDFDKEFLTIIVDENAHEIAKLDAAIGATSDTTFAEYLGKTKAVVQKHRDDAKTLLAAFKP